MNLVELDRALRQLRLSGMASNLETRLQQAQTDKLAPIDLVSHLVSDELLRRQDRLFDRRLLFRFLGLTRGQTKSQRQEKKGLRFPHRQGPSWLGWVPSSRRKLWSPRAGDHIPAPA